MFAQPRQAYVLLGVEPELDCHNPQQAIAALKQAALVVMLTPFASEAIKDYADVLLPTAPFTETSGTFVNCEGRLQSFKGVCRPLGDTRPAWKVLRVLGNLLGLPGFAYDSSEQIRDEIIPKGGEDEHFVGGLDNGVNGLALSPHGERPALQRIAEVPIYFADPLVRRAPRLAADRRCGGARRAHVRGDARAARHRRRFAGARHARAGGRAADGAGRCNGAAGLCPRRRGAREHGGARRDVRAD